MAFRYAPICYCLAHCAEKTRTGDVSIQQLFGDLCSSNVFRHDMQMQELQRSERTEEKLHTQETQLTQQTSSPSPGEVHSSPIISEARLEIPPAVPCQVVSGPSPNSASQGLRREAVCDAIEYRLAKRSRLTGDYEEGRRDAANAILSHQDDVDDWHSSISRLTARLCAADAAVMDEWHKISLVSTKDNHTFEEVEL